MRRWIGWAMNYKLGCWLSFVNSLQYMSLLAGPGRDRRPTSPIESIKVNSKTHRLHQISTLRPSQRRKKSSRQRRISRKCHYGQPLPTITSSQQKMPNSNRQKICRPTYTRTKVLSMYGKSPHLQSVCAPKVHDRNYCPVSAPSTLSMYV